MKSFLELIPKLQIRTPGASPQIIGSQVVNPYRIDLFRTFDGRDIPLG